MLLAPIHAHTPALTPAHDARALRERRGGLGDCCGPGVGAGGPHVVIVDGHRAPTHQKAKEEVVPAQGPAGDDQAARCQPGVLWRPWHAVVQAW